MRKNMSLKIGISLRKLSIEETTGNGNMSPVNLTEKSYNILVDFLSKL